MVGGGGSCKSKGELRRTRSLQLGPQSTFDLELGIGTLTYWSYKTDNFTRYLYPFKTNLIGSISFLSGP